MARLLRQNGIRFKREVSFEDLKGAKGELLRFDFAILRNNYPCILIEVDGKQHFEFIKFFHKNSTGWAR